MTTRRISESQLAERYRAQRIRAYVDARDNECSRDDCYATPQTAAAAARCLTERPNDGEPYHTRTTRAQAERKLRKAGYVAAGFAAEDARLIFEEEDI